MAEVRAAMAASISALFWRYVCSSWGKGEGRGGQGEGERGERDLFAGGSHIGELLLSLGELKTREKMIRYTFLTWIGPFFPSGLPLLSLPLSRFPLYLCSQVLSLRGEHSLSRGQVVQEASELLNAGTKVRGGRGKGRMGGRDGGKEAGKEGKRKKGEGIGQ